PGAGATGPARGEPPPRHSHEQAAPGTGLPRVPGPQALGQAAWRRPPRSGGGPRAAPRRSELPHRPEHPGQRCRSCPPRGAGRRRIAAAPCPPQPPRPCVLYEKGAPILAHATVATFSALRLPAFAEALQRQVGNPEFADLSFKGRVGLLVDAEWTHREQRKLHRRLRQANLRRQASLEDIDWLSPRRGLDKALVQALATC